MRPLTFVSAYYENAGMLREQQRCWRELPEDLRAHFHAIVVDDGSPTAPAAPVVEPTGIASFRLFRMLVDVRWNWLACRNLAMTHARTEWVLLTDIDHVVLPATLRRLMVDPLDPKVVYRLSRVDAPNLTPYKPHPNTWVMTRTMFDRVGGYDERFSGYYGTDAEFKERVLANAKALEMLPEAMVRYPREVIADASTTTYLRKQPEDRVVSDIRAARAALPDWKPIRGRFPWVEEPVGYGAVPEEATC